MQMVDGLAPVLAIIHDDAPSLLGEHLRRAPVPRVLLDLVRRVPTPVCPQIGVSVLVTGASSAKGSVGIHIIQCIKMTH